MTQLMCDVCGEALDKDVHSDCQRYFMEEDF